MAEDSGTVQMASAHRKVQASALEMVDFEDAQGLNTVKFYQAVAWMIDGKKTRLQDVVIELVSKGKTFSGYGASLSVTTPIPHFGIGEILESLEDDAHRNQGLFCLKCYLPVPASYAIYDHRPDCMAICTWPYAASIFSKNQRILVADSRLIEALPTAGVCQSVSSST